MRLFFQQLPLLLIGSFLVAVSGYNTPDCAEWPNVASWDALSTQLSDDARLLGPIKYSDYEQQCSPDVIDNTNPFDVATAGSGICMQYPDCKNEFCLPDTNRTDLPAYVIDARTEEDILAGIEFANEHDIQVTVKSTGHSAVGASTAYGSLLIWLSNYPRDNTIETNYQDSCGTSTDAVVRVAAGSTFISIAEAIGDDYHIVTGNEPTVGASGGWVMGNGLSFTSRQYGLGVDNVVDFRVALTSGEVVLADACTNPDLFFALRGGGGGSYGIVTQMHYKLHPPTPITRVGLRLSGVAAENLPAVFSEFLRYWIDISPTLDNRWGGLWNLFGLDLFFAGPVEDANATFIAAFDEWFSTVLDPLANGAVPLPSSTIETYTSWANLVPSLIVATGTPFIAYSSNTRLVPIEVFEDQPDELFNQVISFATKGALGIANYYLGGVVNDVNTTATSVHPATRKAIWSIQVFDLESGQELRDFLPNSMTGVSKNHEGPLEPDWEEAFWGSNYPKLLELKKKYDPNNRFNPYHGVGYIGEEVDNSNVEEELEKDPSEPPVAAGICPATDEPTSTSFGTKQDLALFGLTLAAALAA